VGRRQLERLRGNAFTDALFTTPVTSATSA